MEVGSQFHAPVILTPGNNSGTHYIGGWEGPIAGLDVLVVLLKVNLNI